MKRDFLSELAKNGILADGAMGTEIYARGVFINRCYDELNLSNPQLIREIHSDYLKAGAGLLETNTFTANRAALSAFSCEEKVEAINLAGVRIAREVAGVDAFVAGAVGPISWAVKSAELPDAKRLRDFFEEQITALAKGGCDAIILETFHKLDELQIAVEACRHACDLPLIAQLSFKYLEDEGFVGLDPAQAARTMTSWGVDVMGANCSDGPQGVYEAIVRMVEATNKPLSAMPNAGLPKMVQGRLMYLAAPEYFAEYARRYAQLGVSLIGGCCGTQPAHIREAKKYLQALKPTKRGSPSVSAAVCCPGQAPVPLAQRSSLGAGLGQRFLVSVEIDPPLGTNPAHALEGAKLMRDLGVDAVNIADGPRAVARMGALALGALIKNQVGIEPIVHFCCRDRNLLGLQMDLIGASAQGLHNVLIITGDPPKMGHYPDATAVFDLDSVGLIHSAANLNRALDFAGRPMKDATRLVIGCGVNPGALDLDREVQRFEAKIQAGAEFVFSQPVFDVELLQLFLKRTSHLPAIPFFVGILPLASLRNAEFLHNEVPGMQIPEPVLARMRGAASRETQQEVGLSVAREALSAARKLDRIGGVYIFPPFGNYQVVGKLLEVLR